MYKLIALDVDGTLVNSNKEITKEVYDAIQKARKQGVKVVIATGRPLPGAMPLLEELDLIGKDEYLICFNGSLVQEVESGQIISQQEMSASDFREIFAFAKENNAHFHINTPTGLVVPTETVSPYTIHETEICGIPYHQISESEVTDEITFCKMMIADEPELIEKLVSIMPESLKEQYTVVRSAPFFLEFLNKNAHKGNGLQALCDHLGISIDEVIAVGDEENDQHMIKYAGLGVAMGNARESIKEIANHITKTNNEHGVAHVIHEFILKEEKVSEKDPILV